jgi:hypothetical protein
MFGGARAVTSGSALVVLVAAGVHAQSAADILDRMLAEYERRTEGVQDYTIVQETMGVETVSYFEKEMVDGRSVFRLRRVGTAGAVVAESDAEESGWDEFYTVLPQMMTRSLYEGQDEIEGHAVHVVLVNDLDEINFGPGSAQEGGDFEPERARLFVDVDQWIVRRMVFEGRMTAQGETHEVTSTADFRDFRDVEGMIHPFHMVVRMEGLGEAMGPEMRQQLEEMRQQLEEMPEAQRKMMEEMMKGQMAQFENMMGDEGGMQVEIHVVELKVNTGPGGD